MYLLTVMFFLPILANVLLALPSTTYGTLGPAGAVYAEWGIVRGFS